MTSFWLIGTAILAAAIAAAGVAVFFIRRNKPRKNSPDDLYPLW